MNLNNAFNIAPKKIARVAGLLYLVIIIAGIFAEVFVRSKLTVQGDPDATAANILAHEQLWRTGFVAEMIMLLCDVGVVVILYQLLRPVGKNIALLAAALRLLSDAISGINELHHFSALFPLGNDTYLHAFTPQQLHTLAYLSIKSFSLGYNISLTFFGCYCMVLGYSVFRSGYMPKAIGILLILAGVCYLTNSFSWFMAPKFAGLLFPAILVPCFIAELALCLWLIIKGVDAKKWEKALQTNTAH